MPSLAVTVIGRDRPGIIAEVTGVVADLGGNLEDSSMTLLRGHFAWMLVADVDVAADELAARLGHLRADGLVVTVVPVGPDEPYGSDTGSYVLSVHGADRPGIASTIFVKTWQIQHKSKVDLPLRIKLLDKSLKCFVYKITI